MATTTARKIQRKIEQALKLARIASVSEAQVGKTITIDSFEESALDNATYLLRDMEQVVELLQKEIDKQKFYGDNRKGRVADCY